MCVGSEYAASRKMQSISKQKKIMKTFYANSVNGICLFSVRIIIRINFLANLPLKICVFIIVIQVYKVKVYDS